MQKKYRYGIVSVKEDRRIRQPVCVDFGPRRTRQEPVLVDATLHVLASQILPKRAEIGADPGHWQSVDRCPIISMRRPTSGQFRFVIAGERAFGTFEPPNFEGQESRFEKGARGSRVCSGLRDPGAKSTPIGHCPCVTFYAHFGAGGFHIEHRTGALKSLHGRPEVCFLPARKVSERNAAQDGQRRYWRGGLFDPP